MRNKNTPLALSLFFVLICAVVVASCFTPLVLRAIDTLSFLEGLRKYSGAKVFRRLMILFFLMGVWLQRRRLALPSAEEIGFARHRAWRQHVITGLLVGLVGLFGLEAAALGLGYRVPDSDFGTALLLEAVVRGLATAVAVGILEEIVEDLVHRASVGVRDDPAHGAHARLVRRHEQQLVLGPRRRHVHQPFTLGPLFQWCEMVTQKSVDRIGSIISAARGQFRERRFRERSKFTARYEQRS